MTRSASTLTLLFIPQVTFERLQAVQPGVEHYLPFLSLIPSGGQILDAGCGSGRDSRFFIQQGYAVTAMDASAALGRLAAESLGQAVLHLTFEEMSFEHCFDGVWASHALLHVSRTSLMQVLARIGRALKPGGVLYASFNYGQGELRRGGLLFNDFDEDTFAAILGDCPMFAPIRMWQLPEPPPTRPGKFIFNVLLKRI